MEQGDDGYGMERRVILSRLLGKYEKSKHLLEPGTSNRRVILRVDQNEIPEYEYENPDVRDAFHAAAKLCCEQRLIDIAWVSGRPVFSELILNLERVNDAYIAIGKTHPGIAALNTVAKIEQALSAVSTPWICSWKQATIQKANSTYKLPAFLSGSSDIADDFLNMLCQYDALQGNAVTMRAFSIRCFQDSKRFEKAFRDEFLRSAVQYDPILSELCQHQDMGPREKLAYLGIYARPEIYELSGRISFSFKNGTVDCTPLFPEGIALRSTSVDYIEHVDLSGVGRVIFIENKTNYDEYLNSEIQLSDLLVYHGGFLSPQKRKLIRKICDALPLEIPVYFWADIDLGGFRMFCELQSIFPQLQPMRMEASDVIKYASQGLARTEKYLKRIKDALENNEYPLFCDAMQAIINFGVTIEQEVFLSNQ